MHQPKHPLRRRAFAVPGFVGLLKRLSGCATTGWLWLRVSDGAVLRTQLMLKLSATRTEAGMKGSVVVEYRRNQKLGMWVPTRMQEAYEQIGGINDALDCTATYAHFRRFETSSRILP